MVAEKAQGDATNYIGESALRAITLEVIRMHAPSTTDIRMARRSGPFLPGNWRVERIDVLAEEYGTARDMADQLAAASHYIAVPDEHPLAGQVYGRETGHEWR